MKKKICPKCGKLVRISKDSYIFVSKTEKYWHLKCYPKNREKNN